MTLRKTTAEDSTDLTDRIEMSLGEMTVIEQVLWEKVRVEGSLEHLNYPMLHVMGKIHKAAGRLRQKINEAGKK